MAEDVYCTLLLNDRYLPGVQVLAHSLRDAGAANRLAVMVVLDGVTERTVVELKRLYDYVIPVDPIYSTSAENLELMGRTDLHAALTKLNLWRQTQFRKVVYLDADVVALRAPDELFEVDADFAAAPDVGWPDCFNSGMMLCSPSEETYGKLLGLAEQGASFDGADQGLLNQHFEDWQRLPFTYNCTVGEAMAYQYAPAFNHYKSKLSMVHFIGNQKPWDRGTTPGLSSSNDPYDKLSGHWWAVWNKHHSPIPPDVGSQPKEWEELGDRKAEPKGDHFGEQEQVQVQARVRVQAQVQERERERGHPAKEILAASPPMPSSREASPPHETVVVDTTGIVSPPSPPEVPTYVSYTGEPQRPTPVRGWSPPEAQLKNLRGPVQPPETAAPPAASPLQETKQTHALGPGGKNPQAGLVEYIQPQFSDPAPPKPTMRRESPDSNGRPHREALFVPKRSIDAPSRYAENFTAQDAEEAAGAAEAIPGAPEAEVVTALQGVESESPTPFENSGQRSPNLTHHEEHKRYGKLPEIVNTPQGPIPQVQYFKTGANSYHIQQYFPSGHPITQPKEIRFESRAATPVPIQAHKTVHQVPVQQVLQLHHEQTSELSPAQEETLPTGKEYKAPFSAPQSDWDPKKSAPPPGSVPEARDLRIQTYINTWDSPQKAGSSVLFVPPPVAPPPKEHLWYSIPETEPEPPEAPPSKPLFPWEDKPRIVSRVFAASEGGSTSESSDDGGSLESDEEEDTPPGSLPSSLVPPSESQPMRDWSSFTLENTWDRDPGIRDYVLGLQRRGSNVPDGINVALGALHGIPGPITPGPRRRRSSAWPTNDNNGGQWDPERQLEALQRLPKGFERTLTKPRDTRSLGVQTDPEPAAIYRPTPVYRTSVVQTDPTQHLDKSTQWDSDSDSDDEMTVTDVELGTPPMRVRSYSKSSSRKSSFGYVDEGIDLKKIAGIPMGSIRGRRHVHGDTGFTGLGAPPDSFP